MVLALVKPLSIIPVIYLFFATYVSPGSEKSVYYRDSQAERSLAEDVGLFFSELGCLRPHLGPCWWNE